MLPDYQLKRRKGSRGISITVGHQGDMRVSAPLRATVTDVESFLSKQKDWILRTVEKQQKASFGKTYLKSSRKEFTATQSRALELARTRLFHFNTTYGFQWKSITIRRAKSRWGSCSSGRRLNFNYQIANLPPHLADYIVVHELCHLGEMNHSSRFWAQMAKAMPDWKARRQELRKRFVLC